MPYRRSAVTYLYNDVFDIKTRDPPHSKKLGRAIAFKILNENPSSDV
jgi:hypothetical protein